MAVLRGGGELAADKACRRKLRELHVDCVWSRKQGAKRVAEQAAEEAILAETCGRHSGLHRHVGIAIRFWRVAEITEGCAAAADAEVAESKRLPKARRCMRRGR